MILSLSCLGYSIIQEIGDDNLLFGGNWLLLLANQFLPNIKTLSPTQEILKILRPVKSTGGTTGTVNING